MGVGAQDYGALSISEASLATLMSRGGFQQRLAEVYTLTQSHFSYEVQFDVNRVRPICVRKCTQ
jgi:hypothetical protein